MKRSDEYVRAAAAAMAGAAAQQRLHCGARKAAEAEDSGAQSNLQKRYQ